ncbi:hypothetical protein [Dubosiella newyorkensis]|jgi:hypothetical protein|uniref:hypothetical protein n=1 Tax=Dubosiella newyorkensis TaxID=1862672 RepID=UPI002354B3CA|nr:hypothetical protein [Dubosiella newyorkensis]MCI9041653.1 hypothetical protein [Dubosiella newyorkensis]
MEPNTNPIKKPNPQDTLVHLLMKAGHILHHQDMKSEQAQVLFKMLSPQQQDQLKEMLETLLADWKKEDKPKLPKTPQPAKPVTDTKPQAEEKPQPKEEDNTNKKTKKKKKKSKKDKKHKKKKDKKNKTTKEGAQ